MKLALLAGLAATALPAVAEAGGRWGFSFGFGPVGGYYASPGYCYRPRYYCPPPVYYGPPPVAYDAPAYYPPTYYAPPPVVYSAPPAVVYDPPVVYGPSIGFSFGSFGGYRGRPYYHHHEYYGHGYRR